VEDPGDLVNPEEEIPCIAAYGIQKNSVWDSVISRSDGYAPKSIQNNAIAPPEANDVAGDIPLPNDIDLADPADEEDETTAVLLTGNPPRRPPTPLPELNLAIFDDETREEIKNLEGEWHTSSEQVRTVTDLLCGRSWSLSKIAAVFQMTKGTLSKVYARSLTPRLRNGRPSALTREQLEFVEMLIRVGFDWREPVTYSDIMVELELEYGVYLLPDTLRHVIHRIPWCKTIDGVPQEASRVQCDEEEIDR
jgi:transposase